MNKSDYFVATILLMASIAYSNRNPICWDNKTLTHYEEYADWNSCGEFILKNVKIEKSKMKIDSVQGISANGYGFRAETVKESKVLLIDKRDSLNIKMTSFWRNIGEIKWVNENVIFIRLWPGKIRVCDWYYDVENERTLFVQEALEGYITRDQHLEKATKSEKDKCR